MRNVIASLARAASPYARDMRPTLRYWMETEVHVYGFSIAANVLLSFWPFLLVMVSLCRHVLHWPAAEQAIYLALRDYFAGETGEFLARNLLDKSYRVGALSFFSIFLLLFTANGIFLPLEVALNRALGATVNRTFWKNQVVGSGLIFACGVLALISIALPGWGQKVLRDSLGDGPLVHHTGVLFFKLVSVPITILILFLIYWLLPNARIPGRLMLPGAVVAGLALELLKWINLLIWPLLHQKLWREYYPFNNSVTIVLWSFFAGLVVLAGADWSARRARRLQNEERNRDRIRLETHP